MPGRHLNHCRLICRPLGPGLAPSACDQLFSLVASRDHVLVHRISGNGHMAVAENVGYETTPAPGAGMKPV